MLTPPTSNQPNPIPKPVGERPGPCLGEGEEGVLDVHEDLSETCFGSQEYAGSSRHHKASVMRRKRTEFIEARKSRLCKKQKDLDVKLISSDTVPSELIHDKSKPMVIIGSDVVSLYPNLTWEAAGNEVYRAVVDSSIKWEGISWQDAVLYLALCRGHKWCKSSNLRRVLPERKKAKGSWPGVTGDGPLGPASGDDKKWRYTFGGKYYRQSDGGPIGVRLTCAIARVFMAMHSIK